jgi:hypothetical protein
VQLSAKQALSIVTPAIIAVLVVRKAPVMTTVYQMEILPTRFASITLDITAKKYRPGNL